MYQHLTANELKSLLADRAIPGRSKATTKAAMIALLEAHDSESKSEPAPTPVPTPQPEPEETRPVPAPAPIPFRHRELPAATTLPSGGGQIAPTRPGESGIPPAQEIAQAIAQVLAPLSQELAALRQQLATGTSTQSPGEAFPPPGPWLNSNGELRPDFIDWIAAQWRNFPNRASQTDWQIRGDVFKHLQKPGKLTPAWVSFENDLREREEKEAVLAANGIAPLRRSFSTPEEYADHFLAVSPAYKLLILDAEGMEFQRKLQDFAEKRRKENEAGIEKISAKLPFPRPENAAQLRANLAVLVDKFDMNSKPNKPKSPAFSAEHYQAVARSYRARYAAAVAKSDEVEF